jgi:hypothetical protein
MIGRHHHVTVVMLSHGFLTLETLRARNFWLDPAETRREIQRLLCAWTGECCYCGSLVRAPIVILNGVVPELRTSESVYCTAMVTVLEMTEPTLITRGTASPVGAFTGTWTFT